MLSGKLGDLVYVHSNLQLALSNVAKDESNSSSSWLEFVRDALGDQDDLGIGSDRDSGESNGDHDSSGLTPPSALDDLDLFDVTSKPREHQEKNLCSHPSFFLGY